MQRGLFERYVVSSLLHAIFADSCFKYNTTGLRTIPVPI